jgi:hypothetical protein
MIRNYLNNKINKIMFRVKNNKKIKKILQEKLKFKKNLNIISINKNHHKMRHQSKNSKAMQRNQSTLKIIKKIQKNHSK